VSIRFLKLALLAIPTLVQSETYPNFPNSQPEQPKSQIQFDPRLDSPLFNKQRFSKIEGFDSKRVEHNSNCISDFQYKHTVRSCESKRFPDGRIEIYIHDNSPSTYDNLLITIVGNQYSCQYWSAYLHDPENTKIVWKTTKQNLKLKNLQSDPTSSIYGYIEFECDHYNSAHPDRMLKHIRISGFFKSKLTVLRA